MNTFTLQLYDASQQQRVENVTSFVGEDANGCFGLQAHHARFMTTLIFGLFRYRLQTGDWQYLALPGGVLYFNDNEFKHALDHYKYADRYPEHTMEIYRQQGEVFLQQLEEKLTINDYLMGPEISLTDMAVFPFIRQFAYVDKDWFDQTSYTKLQKWLEQLLNTKLFHQVMRKYPRWHNGDEPQVFD